jgi:hypothetical protein
LRKSITSKEISLERKDPFQIAAWALGEKETVETHVLGTPPVDARAPGYIYHSVLNHALREMNSASARRNSRFIVPLLTAFAILDQIGECYGLHSRIANQPTGSIKRALHHFAPASERVDPSEAHALYVFRNGLMHDASFSSYDRSKSRWWVFRILNDVDRLSVPPREMWDGKPENISERTITWINAERLVDFVNLAVSRLIIAVRTADADLAVHLSPQDIASRYLLWTRADSAISIADGFNEVSDAVNRRAERNERMAARIGEFRDSVIPPSSDG